MSATTYASNTRHAESTRHRRTRIVSGHERPPAGRALLEVVALIAIAILLIAGVVLTSGRVHAAGPTQRVFVERGQTLWAIASQHAVAGQTTEQTAQQRRAQRARHRRCHDRDTRRADRPRAHCVALARNPEQSLVLAPPAASAADEIRSAVSPTPL